MVEARKIGDAIVNEQYPFENRPTDTPLTAISQAIEANIKMLLGEKVQVSVQKQSFYQL
ncbi:MAG: hypothetical protein Tsb0034_25300 [Ekhidna sp.]